MIPREVGEPRRRERRSVHAVGGEPDRGDLHRHQRGAAVSKSGEQVLQLRRGRSRVALADGHAVEQVPGRSDQARRPAERPRDVGDEVGHAGLAVGARHSDEHQGFPRAPFYDRAEVTERARRGADKHDWDARRGLDLALDEHRTGVGGDVVMSIEPRPADRDEDIAVTHVLRAVRDPTGHTRGGGVDRRGDNPGAQRRREAVEERREQHEGLGGRRAGGAGGWGKRGGLRSTVIRSAFRQLREAWRRDHWDVGRQIAAPGHPEGARPRHWDHSGGECPRWRRPVDETKMGKNRENWWGNQSKCSETFSPARTGLPGAGDWDTSVP